MGLIQRQIERAGIPTIGISIVRAFSEKVRPPRTVFLDWPFGHPLGEPFNPPQHEAVLKAALRALQEIQTPGQILDLPWPWKGGVPVQDLGGRRPEEAGQGIITPASSPKEASCEACGAANRNRVMTEHILDHQHQRGHHSPYPERKTT